MMIVVIYIEVNEPVEPSKTWILMRLNVILTVI